MKKAAYLVIICFASASIVLLTRHAFAEGYTYIDSNTGGGAVEWTNTDDPADGPPVSTVVADAVRLFPGYISQKNLPAVKSFFVKSYNTQRKHAQDWQPIDHIEAMLVGLTAPVNADNEYYLYNCEVHYDRPIGQTKWTVDKNESTITLGDGTPKMGGIHLVASDGTDKTQAGIAEQTQREQEEYDRIHANDNSQKKRPVEESVSSSDDQSSQSSEPAQEQPKQTKSEKKKAAFNKLKGLVQ